MGYQPVENRKIGKLETGTMAIDAIFTPMRKLSYRVENMRVGERTDFDRLVLDLETDGSISPEEAFTKASEILVQHFGLFRDVFQEVEIKEKEAGKPAKKPAKKSTKKHEKKKKRKKV